jgi:uncharacterized membrane protein
MIYGLAIYQRSINEIMAETKTLVVVVGVSNEPKNNSMT